MQLHRIGVISNPASTRLLKSMPQFREAMAAYDQITHVEIENIDDMTPVLRRFSEQNIDLLVLNGGDGTVQAAVTSLLNDHPYDNLPALCILPGGQTNMTAEAIDVAGAPEDILPALVKAFDDCEGAFDTVSLPFVGLRLTADSAPIYGTFFGAASVVRGLYVCRQKFHPLNLPNFLTHLLAILYLVCSSLNPFKTDKSAMRAEKVSYSVNGDEHTARPYFAFMVTSLDKLILGFDAKSMVGEGALRLNSVDYGGLSLLRAFRTLIFGMPRGKSVKGMTRRNMARISVRCTSPVTLDGEIFDPVPGQPIEISASPPLQFLSISA